MAWNGDSPPLVLSLCLCWWGSVCQRINQRIKQRTMFVFVRLSLLLRGEVSGSDGSVLSMNQHVRGWTWNIRNLESRMLIFEKLYPSPTIHNTTPPQKYGEPQNKNIFLLLVAPRHSTLDGRRNRREHERFVFVVKQERLVAWEGTIRLRVEKGESF